MERISIFCSCRCRCSLFYVACLFTTHSNVKEMLAKFFLIHVRFYKIFTAQRMKASGTSGKGEGVKVNRSVIAAMLNKYTCVFASFVWAHKNWIFIILLSFFFCRRLNFNVQGLFLLRCFLLPLVMQALCLKWEQDMNENISFTIPSSYLRTCRDR